MILWIRIDKCTWVKSSKSKLKKQGSYFEVDSLERGCSWGSVLAPALCNLAYNELLIALEEQRFTEYVHEYENVYYMSMSKRVRGSEGETVAERKAIFIRFSSQSFFFYVGIF